MNTYIEGLLSMGIHDIPQCGTKSSPKNIYPPPPMSMERQWPTTFLMIPLLANWDDKLILARLKPRIPSVFAKVFKSNPCWSYAHLKDKRNFLSQQCKK